jgi:hypothetical protein
MTLNTFSGSRAGKFVVLHKGVGRFHQGQLFTADDLAPGCDLERLFRLGAIRHATEEEACLESVPIKDEPEKHRAYETLMRDNAQLIEAQKLEIAKLTNEVQLLKQGRAQPAAKRK